MYYLFVDGVLVSEYSKFSELYNVLCKSLFDGCYNDVKPHIDRLLENVLIHKHAVLTCTTPDNTEQLKIEVWYG